MTAACQSELFRKELALYFAEENSLLIELTKAVFDGGVAKMKKELPKKVQVFDENKERVWKAVSPYMQSYISLQLQTIIHESVLSSFSNDQIYSALNQLYQSKSLSWSRLQDSGLKEALENAKPKNQQPQLAVNHIQEMGFDFAQKNQETYNDLHKTLQTKEHLLALLAQITYGFTNLGI